MLGVEIIRDRSKREIYFSQTLYINQILDRYGFSQIKPVATPIDRSIVLKDPKTKRTPAEEEFMADKPYRGAVGALLYAAVATRPDISYSVISATRYNNNPGPDNWRAVRRIFQYLQGTKDLRLSLGRANNKLVGYSDSDGMSEPGRKPINGYIFNLG